MTTATRAERSRRRRWSSSGVAARRGRGWRARGRGGPGSGAAQEVLLEAAELRAQPQADGAAEDPAGPVERPQGLRPPGRRPECRHQVHPPLLPERLVLDGALQPVEDRRGAPGPQLEAGEEVLCRQPLLPEPLHRPREPQLRAQPVEGRAGPEGQRLHQHRHGPVRGREGDRTGVVDEMLEDAGVDRPRPGLEAVAPGHGDEEVVEGHLGEPATEPGHGHAQAAARGVLAPEPLREVGGRQETALGGHQGREEPQRCLAAHRHTPPAAVEVERPQNPDLPFAHCGGPYWPGEQWLANRVSGWGGALARRRARTHAGRYGHRATVASHPRGAIGGPCVWHASPMLRFGTDGVRGEALTELTPELVLALGRAAARTFRPTLCVIARDTRESGPVLEAALSSGLAAEGVDVVLLGVAPTPAVAWISAADSVLGAVISASHNPYQDNGVKLFAPGGRKLTDAEEEALEAELDRILAEDASTPDPGAEPGSVQEDPGGVQRWEQTVAGSIGGRGLDGVFVVVDAAHGAASRVSPAEVLRRARRQGGGAPRGPRRHQHQRRVRLHLPAGPPGGGGRALGADVGIALDGDADRALAVDAAGRLVDGDQIIAIAAIDRKARGVLAGDAVVVTVMTNLGFRRGDGRPRHRGGGGAGRRPPRPRGAGRAAGSSSAASRAATSSSAIWRPPATGCSPRCSCSTWWRARAEPWPSWPTTR